MIIDVKERERLKTVSNERIYSAIAVNWIAYISTPEPPWALYQEFIDRYRAGTWDQPHLTKRDYDWIRRGVEVLNILR